MRVGRLCWNVLLLLGLALQMGLAQQGQFATTKIADNVYVFRYMFHQAMFVVTPEGVIVTDPISVEAAKSYLEEIRKITQAPVRYVIYSHHHADHITGGAAFQGATFVAHKLGKERLEQDKPAGIVIPTEAVNDRRTITLGGTTLELIYTGRNHSDNSLVMLLPKEKILFAVDFIPVQALPFRDLPDFYINEWVDSMKKVQALDFTTFIPGHPPTPGSKEDIGKTIEYVTDLMAAAKKAHGENKCNAQEIKLSKYEKWANYEQYLPLNVGRMCRWAATGE
jgi:glyoxylase-like metal-dependent hydrolase (beta-lactamase superfamily II)